MRVRIRTLVLFALLGCVCGGCKDEPRSQGTPPPPPASASKLTAACAGGGGHITDAVSAPFFPVTVAGYCLDPNGDEKTYGDQGKLKIDELCTTALDGGCEEYKKFGVTRSVIVHYIANAGAGTVEVFLSQFAGDGAYAIYTTRLTGEIDPADEHAARPLAILGFGNVQGALGTGKAYAQRGPYFLELTYTNDQETPDQMKKSSDAILTSLAKAIAEKLPPSPEMPASAKALSDADRIPNGVAYFQKDVLGVPGGGVGAVGYYRAGDKRWRDLAAVRDSDDQAKDLVHALRTKPGTMPIASSAGLGDDALLVVLQAAPERAKVEWVIARKGSRVVGVGDEELVQDAKAHLSKDEKIDKARSLVK